MMNKNEILTNEENMELKGLFGKMIKRETMLLELEENKATFELLLETLVSFYYIDGYLFEAKELEELSLNRDYCKILNGYFEELSDIQSILSKYQKELESLGLNGYTFEYNELDNLGFVNYAIDTKI